MYVEVPLQGDEKPLAKIPIGHIVKKLVNTNGKGVIYICDDYCRDVTPEEAERQKQEIYRIFANGQLKQRTEQEDP